MLFRNTSSSHGAKISLVCNSTMSKEDTEFKYLNVTERSTEYYVSKLFSEHILLKFEQQFYS